jgi:hypothetical protein
MPAKRTSAGRHRCDLGERLIGGERGHVKRGCHLPGNGGRLSRDECGWSDERFRPGALVSQRQWLGAHLVARCEGRHLQADRDHDAGRLDPEGQRRLAADVPAANADDLIPVANPGRVHRDHDLERSRPSEVHREESAGCEPLADQDDHVAISA